jgi:PEP-CTERM motif
MEILDNTSPIETPNMLFSMNLTRLRYLVAATALVLMTFPLRANVILPGQSGIAPDVFPNPGSPPLLGVTNGTFSFGSGTGLLTGSYFEAVLVDPLGVTCTGCLDFAFQVNEDSGLSSGIFSLDLSRFFGYTTDVGYIAGTGHAGDGPGNGDPISVSRGPFGGGIGFRFSAPGSTSNTIGPGGSTDILVVATNATTYDTLGALGISGGSGANSPANGQITGLFEPTVVPEPSTVVLLSLGLAGIAAFRKRIS